MRSRTFAGLAVAALVAAALVAPAGPAHAVGETISQIAANASYHCRRTFGTGLFDSVANKTFVTYNGPGMDLYVRAYDHGTGTWQAATKVYDWNDTSANAYHDYGTLTLLPDGRLGIFVVNHTSSAYLVKAPTPHSASGTWTRTTISTDRNTYPMPVVSGSTIYFFYSRNDDLSWPYRTYRYIKSTDGGATWSAPSTIIDSGRTSDKYNEVYAFGTYLRDGRIYLTWTMAGGPGGHNNRARDLHLSYLDTATGRMHAVDAGDLGAVVDAADLSKTLVRASAPASTGTDYAALHPIQNSAPGVADDGTVVVGFGDTRNDGTRTVQLGRFSSGAWSFSTVDSATADFKDLVKSGASFEVLYASGGRLIDRRTADRGATWSTEFDLAVPYGGSNADTTFYANFIENRQEVRVVAGTINHAERNSDYTGKWPVVAITR